MASPASSLPAAAQRLSLRAALKLDAVVTGANGLAYLALAGPLADVLGLSAPLLRGVGAFLAVFAAAVWATGTRRRVPRAGAWVIVAANAAWALSSVAAAVAGWGDPTTAGTVWVLLQALVVGGFAELQAFALRRGRAA